MNPNNTHDYESILLCLEQKSIFATDVLNITKQIEVQSNQEELDLDELLEQRQSRIQRMMKCDELIQTKLSDFDKEEGEHWQQIIDGEQCEIEGKEQKKAAAYVEAIGDTSKRIVTLQKSVMKNLRAQYEEAKENLTQLNKNNMANTNIFHV